MKILKNKQWDLIKHRSFCIEKDTINKTGREPQNGRKYLQIMLSTNLQNIQMVRTT